MNTELNLPPFYQFQRVVYIGNNPKLKKNGEYVVMDLLHTPCGCWAIDVGKNAESVTTRTCKRHNKQFNVDNYTTEWFFADLFVPLESTFQSISFQSVAEKESKLIGVN